MSTFPYNDKYTFEQFDPFPITFPYKTNISSTFKCVVAEYPNWGSTGHVVMK